MASTATPATITEWFELELNKKLASLSSDRERRECLNRQSTIWANRRERFFATDGASEMPHAVYGFATATDFLIFLSTIDNAKFALEQSLVLA